MDSRSVARLKRCLRKAGHVLSHDEFVELLKRHITVLESLPDDVLMELILLFDLRTIGAICSSSKRFNAMCLKHREKIVAVRDRERELARPSIALDKMFGKGDYDDTLAMEWAEKVFSGELEMKESYPAQIVSKSVTLNIPLRDLWGYTLTYGPETRYSVLITIMQDLEIRLKSGRDVYNVHIKSDGSYKVYSNVIELKGVDPTMDAVLNHCFVPTDGSKLHHHTENRLELYESSEVDIKCSLTDSVSRKRVTKMEKLSAKFAAVHKNLKAGTPQWISVSGFEYGGSKRIEIEIQVINHPQLGVLLHVLNA